MAIEQEPNEFMLSLLDLSGLLRVTPQATHKAIKKAGIPTYMINGRAYLIPEDVRSFLLSRGYSYIFQAIAIEMLKGGVGKTTTVQNLGIRANMYGARVLLIDLDQQANLSLAFGLKDPDAKVWVDVVEGSAKVESTIHRLSSTFHIIPSNLNNSMLDRVLLSGKRNVATGISQYLTPIRDHYDIVIMDTAPNLSAINTAAACASSIVVLPVNPDVFSFDGLSKTLSDLKSIKKEFSACFEVKILFNKFDGRETSSHELLKNCIANYSQELLKGFIRTSTEFKNTIQSGKTIFDAKSNAKAKEDFDLVTRELIGFVD